MARTFISPSKYIQGPGEMDNIGAYAGTLGKSAVVLISAGGRKRTGAQIEESFEKADVALSFVTFDGECSKKEISRVLELAKDTCAEVIVGVGGGKIFDTAKAVAYYLEKPVVIVPTIAATDAPCSALSVIYTEEGAVEEYLFLRQNPNIVVMDSAVIAKSPVRLTVSGMGDALATYFEARASHKHDGDNFANGKPTHTAMALARLCFDMLMSDGYQAVVALKAGALTESVEKVIEANTLLSGLGFESGGVAAAHAIHNGFAALPECHHMYHGEKVAIGVLTQLVLENSPREEFEQVLNFCVSVGLPVTLAQIGVEDPTPEKILKVAEIACAPTDTAVNMPFAINPQMIADAIMTADAFGRAALANANA